jgi:hypothetical protein
VHDGLRHVYHFEQDLKPLAGSAFADHCLHALDRSQAGLRLRGVAAARVLFKETTALRRFRQGGMDQLVFRLRHRGRRPAFVGQGFF